MHYNILMVIINLCSWNVVSIWATKCKCLISNVYLIRHWLSSVTQTCQWYFKTPQVVGDKIAWKCVALLEPPKQCNIKFITHLWDKPSNWNIWVNNIPIQNCRIVLTYCVLEFSDKDLTIWCTIYKCMSIIR